MFTLIFFPASSSDADLTKLLSAAFEDEYKEMPLFPIFEETDEIKNTFLKSLVDRGLIDEENLENADTSDYALMLQIFVGRGDFFFCHWMAVDEQSIIDRLSADGSDKFMITMATPVEFPKMNLDYILPMIKKIK